MAETTTTTIPADGTGTATVLTGESPIPAEKTETATVLTGESPKANKVARRDERREDAKAKKVAGRDETASRSETGTSIWDWFKNRHN